MRHRVKQIFFTWIIEVEEKVAYKCMINIRILNYWKYCNVIIFIELEVLMSESRMLSRWEALIENDLKCFHSFPFLCSQFFLHLFFILKNTEKREGIKILSSFSNVLCKWYWIGGKYSNWDFYEKNCFQLHNGLIRNGANFIVSNF